MRRLLVVTVSVFVLVSAVALARSTHTIKVADNYYVRSGSAPTVGVSAGTTVVFKWRALSDHNVVVTSGPTKFSSPTMSSGSYSRTLTRRGTYRIVCTLHRDMKMTIKVS